MRPIRAAAVLLLLGAAAVTVVCRWPAGEPEPPREEPGPAAATPAPAGATAGAAARQPEPRRSRAGRSGLAAPASNGPAVHGIVTKRGKPVGDRMVECLTSRRSTRTAADGSFFLAVDPGTCLVAVPFAAGTRSLQSDYRHWPPDPQVSLHAALRRVLVGAGPVRWDLALPPGAILVTARDATSREPIPDVELVVRPPAPTTEQLHLVTDAGGRARFADVAAGTHRITGHRRGFERATAEVVVAQETRAVALLLEPTGALDVVLVDERGQPLPIPRAQTVDLLNMLTSGVRHSNHRRGDPARRAFEFDDVLPGSYWVTLPADRDVGDEGRRVRFAPAESRTLTEVEVVAGQVTRVEVPVLLRSYAKLSAVDREGNVAAASLRVEWLDPERGSAEVEPAIAGDQGFRGHLVPGTYALTFERDGRTHREILIVDRAPIERTFTMPW